VVLFHFQFLGQSGWEPMGSGRSSGEDPLLEAVEDLRILHGGELPPGRYQYIEAHTREARLTTFDLGVDGEMVD
jgi:hypothetical protein